MALVNAVKLKCVAFVALPLLPTQVSQCERKRRKSRGQVRYAFNVSSSKSVEVEREERIEIVEEILSGEWPESLSILNFEDLSVYYEPLVFKAQVDFVINVFVIMY